MVKKARVATLTAVCLLALPSAAGAQTSARVTIQDEAAGFSGFVMSSRQSCESGRKVILYKQRGSRRDRSRDRRIGTDTAQPNGPDSQWSIKTDEGGRFYAYVGRTRSCKAAYSKTISQ